MSLTTPLVVKAEAAEERPTARPSVVAGGGSSGVCAPSDLIELSSSDSDTDGEGGGGGSAKRARGAAGDSAAGKRARVSAAAAADVPPGFLDPLPTSSQLPSRSATKQFWKAGDYDGKPLGNREPQPSVSSGLEHVRVHPKFLHSNATSHKWALGALAELLDNSLDEVINGATVVNIDMLENRKDKTRMLLVQDNGGGMDPDKMRQCMSLGYSAKSQVASTIGQYGNGFKTSTMRLGADVLVFSRSHGKEGKRPTQSIGMLSYTFLRSTGKEDIVVPMIDYEKDDQKWIRKLRTTLTDWNTSLRTIISWSPYTSEAELLEQFSSIKEQGTRVIIYNLWEDDQGDLELDFDTDVNDIQIRGGNRDEKSIQMAKQFPNSKHFLTYRHSLRSYASILYLRVPDAFQMILRGKEIEHHNIVTDMMLKKEVTYRPVATNGVPKDSNMVADVTIGFVKDAKHHVDVQGFNVYHKNRLIKPFWRVWTAAGSGGRGVIGVLEANFIEPAHDKQDFERTTLLSRLEARLVQMQKDYWSGNAHRIGYVGARSFRSSETGGENSPEVSPGVQLSPHHSSKDYAKPKQRHAGKSYSGTSKKSGRASTLFSIQQAEKSARTKRSERSILHGLSDTSDDSDSEFMHTPSLGSRSHTLNGNRKYFHNGSTSLATPPTNGSIEKESRTKSQMEPNARSNGDEHTTIDDYGTIIKQLRDENSSLKEKLLSMEESRLQELVIEQDKSKSLTERVEDLQRQLETANKEQEALIDIFSEERSRRDEEEENLREKLKEASSTIQELLEKLNAAKQGRKV
ncbi:protein MICRORCHIDIA 7 isoform X2 [Brachypodium distachyon]|uniref:protein MICRORCHIDIA 7 isoform X2 n=1 Tax=Brachypodium distachyon TaxID=15368 RepID=UPI00052FEC5F|nr:protein MICRORCHIDIA 7 isoform X2 [Brachypodium distachyon]|eukprot:XP_010239739.1 protein MICRORCHIDIA 7 isoform X2 [Brachypodium distachyon]